MSEVDSVAKNTPRLDKSKTDDDRSSLESLLVDPEPSRPPSAHARKAGPALAHRKASSANAIARAVFDEIVYALSPEDTPPAEKAQHEKALCGLFKGSGGFCRNAVGRREAARAAKWSERSQSEHEAPALAALKYPAIVKTHNGSNGLGVSRYDFDFMVEAIGRVTEMNPPAVKAVGPYARRVLTEMLAERGVAIDLTPPYPKPRESDGEKPKRRTHAEAEREYIARKGSLTWARDLRDVMTAEEFAELRRAIERVDNATDDDDADLRPAVALAESNVQPLHTTSPQTAESAGDDQARGSLKIHSGVVLVPDIESVPLELRTRRQWVAWRYGKTRPNGKREKVPINPRNGRNADVSDPSTWGTIEEALAMRALFDYAGIGFVLTEDDPFAVADLDGCRDPETGDIEYVAARRIGRLDSFTEISPSETGVHVWTLAPVAPGRRKKGGVEIYSTGRFIAFTGRLVSDSPSAILERGDELLALRAEVFGTDGLVEADEPATPPPVCPASREDAAVIGRAELAPTGPRFLSLWSGDRSGFASDSEADIRFCGLLAEHTSDAEQIDRIFRRSERVRSKWDERRKDGTYGSVTIAKAIRNARRPRTLKAVAAYS